MDAAEVYRKDTRKRMSPRRIAQRLAFATTHTAFGLLEIAAPALGARWAERIWFTIPRSRRAGTRPDGLPQGERLEVRFDSRTVVGETWGSGPIVFLIHGWGGWGTQLGAFVAPMVEAGYRVVSVDMPSHGTSEAGVLGPHASHIVEFAETIVALTDKMGPPHAVIAHSLGASSAVIAMQNGTNTEKAVFIAPMANPADYIRGFARLLGFGKRIRSRLQRHIENRVGLPMAAFDLPKMARETQHVSLLVIHDRDDREIPWADGQAIADAWPDAGLITTSDLGHRRILDDAEVVEQAVDFIRQGPNDLP